MMRIARILGLLISAATLGVILGGCWSGIYENPAAQYVNRSDTITLGAGNSKDMNAATHVISKVGIGAAIGMLIGVLSGEIQLMRDDDDGVTICRGEAAKSV